jgi:hypothetical protein
MNKMDVSNFLERETLCENSMSLTAQFNGYYPDPRFDSNKDSYDRSICPLCVRSTLCIPVMAIVGPLCCVCAGFGYFFQQEGIYLPAGDCIAHTYEWGKHSVCCGECP